jgi:very-short-patch-repair endonuclease
MKIIITEKQFDRLINEGSGGHNKMTQDQFIKKAQEIHKDENGNPKYDYSLVNYVNSSTPVEIICPKHNIIFKQIPSKHLQGQGCRLHYLESKSKYSDEDLTLEALKYKTTAEFKKASFPYYNAAIKRGPDFYDKITSHFVPEKESTGENKIAKILVKHNLIDSKCEKSKKCDNREKTFDDCINTKTGRYCRKLRFDFFLPNIDTIIEYDGEQHFKPSTKFGGGKFETTLENDQIKNEYCLENGIKLIRVHYKYPFKDMETAILKALDSNEQLVLIGDYSKY